MSKKRASILENLGWGIAADILLFTTAILLMSVFAFTSFSNAYLIALFVLGIFLIAFVLNRKAGKQADS